jgi:NADH-quinone oxidoreductase subunit E
VADILPNSIPDIDEVRTRWGAFAWTKGNDKQAKAIVGRYPPGRQHSAILPLLDLAQRQVGAETQTQGWLPIPAIEYVAAYLGSLDTVFGEIDR